LPKRAARVVLAPAGQVNHDGATAVIEALALAVPAAVVTSTVTGPVAGSGGVSTLVCEAPA
jgi:hypothetical protein